MLLCKTAVFFNHLRRSVMTASPNPCLNPESLVELIPVRLLCTLILNFLEVVLRHKHGYFGDVSSQLGSPLQLGHLHLCLQRGGSLHRTDQHQLARHTVRTLHCEVAARLLSPEQGETERVADRTQRRDPEHDPGGREVGHHGQVMVGEGVRGLGTCPVVHRTRVAFTATGGKKEKCEQGAVEVVGCQKGKGTLTRAMSSRMWHEGFLGNPHGDTGNRRAC